MPHRTLRKLRFVTCLNCGRSFPPLTDGCVCHEPEHLFTDTDTGEPMLHDTPCEATQ